MTGTSRALRRLGVAGLSAVLMTTGMAAFAATAANAANVNGQATSVDLSPPTDSATVGTCNPFTATVSPSPGTGNSYTVTVKISQPANKGTDLAPQSTTIGFCDVSAFSPSPGANASAPPGTVASGTGTTGGTFAVGSPSHAGNNCSGTSTTPASNPATLTCTAVYTTDANGKVTFGVTSDTAGTMQVNAGVDVNQNGGVDTFEPQDTSTKTWVANVASAIDCTPKTATNAAGTSHTFTCTVTTSAGTPATGQDVKRLVQSGPDASVVPASCPENPTTTGVYGSYSCTVNNGTNGTGTDQIVAWVDVNHNNVVDTGEPQQTVSKTWVLPAPTGASVAVSCAKTVTTTGTAPNTSAVCQDPTTDKDVKFTATVVSGTPSAPVSGVVVNWAITANNNIDNPNTDSETLSGTSCVTDGTGTCSVTLTDTVPTEGESITVTATLPRASGGSSTATGTKRWHNPKPNEARNITVTPDTASQTAGGAQSFKALVTDRFGNPDPNTVVDWTESGPGALRTSTTCTTAADGTCSVDVTSLSSERGTETVTGTISPSNTTAPGTSTTQECQSAAGFSTYDTGGTYNPTGGTGTNTTGGNNTAPGTSAGNCADNGSVTWKAGTPPPPNKRAIAAAISCSSPHKHVLKCRVAVAPKISGLTVVFKRRTASGVHVIGTGLTNSHGVAHLTKRGLKSHKIWRVFAHVRSTSTTRGATTGTVRTKIL